jgi:hypothetical protein
MQAIVSADRYAAGPKATQELNLGLAVRIGTLPAAILVHWLLAVGPQCRNPPIRCLKVLVHHF